MKKEKGLDYNECDGNNEDDENDNGKDADDDYVDNDGDDDEYVDYVDNDGDDEFRYARMPGVE